MQFQDGTVSVNYNNSPTTGETIQNISIDGIQNSIKIIDQLLDTLDPAPGVITSEDSIVTMANKLVSACATSYGVVETDANLKLTAFQRLCIVTAIGKVIELPPSDASGVIPGEEYSIIFPANLTSPGTVSVATGDFMNGVKDDTFAAPLGLVNPNPTRFKSTGTGWWIC